MNENIEKRLFGFEKNPCLSELDNYVTQAEEIQAEIDGYRCVFDRTDVKEFGNALNFFRIFCDNITEDGQLKKYEGPSERKADYPFGIWLIGGIPVQSRSVTLVPTSLGSNAPKFKSYEDMYAFIEQNAEAWNGNGNLLQRMFGAKISKSAAESVNGEKEKVASDWKLIHRLAQSAYQTIKRYENRKTFSLSYDKINKMASQTYALQDQLDNIQRKFLQDLNNRYTALLGIVENDEVTKMIAQYASDSNISMEPNLRENDRYHEPWYTADTPELQDFLKSQPLVQAAHKVLDGMLYYQCIDAEQIMSKSVTFGEYLARKFDLVKRNWDLLTDKNKSDWLQGEFTRGKQDGKHFDVVLIAGKNYYCG